MTILFVTTIHSLIAQIEITGTIVSEGEPLIGATILIKNTTTGTLADENGQFAISAKPNDVLSISYLGFEPLEIKIEKQIELNIGLGTLNLGQLTLEEAITCCYFICYPEGSGMTFRFDGDEINHQEVSSVEQFISAAIPALQYDLIFQGERPLIILDGIPIEFSSELGLPMNDPNPLQLLNVNDIDQISFLPAYSASSLYSNKPNQGIILINTKKSAKWGNHWEANSKFASLQSPYGLSANMSVSEQLLLQDQHLAFSHESANTQIRFSGAFRKLGGNNEQTGFMGGQSRFSLSQYLLHSKLKINMNLAGGMFQENILNPGGEKKLV